MRKLLPYEHQLIEALGVTKEEYLDFLVVQEEYADIKAGTLLDVRNEVTSTTALVLTIVGVLFQVGAALLAPKPEIPEIDDRRKLRQQRFAPTFGFNSAQDLASYGDPVNLVYTNSNDNPFGKVRVNGSLVWSAVENFGSSQFMQLMVVLGASKIKKIDFRATAIGQKDLSNLDRASFFIFARTDGKGGVPTFKNIKFGYKKGSFFPKPLKPSDGSFPATSIAVHGNTRKGFSQAYSPTTATSLGVFDSIPLNVNVIERNEKGRQKRANLLVRLESPYDNTSFSIGQKITLRFEKANQINGHEGPGETAINMRRQMLESLDFGSTYMLGSAKFKLFEFGTNRNLEEGNVTATFECVLPGRTPTTVYERTEPADASPETKEQIENAVSILGNVAEEGVTRNLSEENNFIDFVNIDVKDPLELEVVYGTKEGMELVKNNELTPFVLNPENPDDHPFDGAVTWVPQLKIKNEDGAIIGEYAMQPQTLKFYRGGSVQYTEEIKSDVPPEIDLDPDEIEAIKKRLQEQKKGLKNIIHAIQSCVFDGDSLPLSNNSFNNGLSIVEQPNKTNSIHSFSGSILAGDQTVTNQSFASYDKKIMGDQIITKANLSSIPNVFYTFNYLDRNGVVHYFNFNGVFDHNVDAPFFVHDDKLTNKLNDLEENKKKLQDLINERTKLQKQGVTISGEDVLKTTTEVGQPFYDEISAAQKKVEKASDKVNRRILRNFGVMHDLAIEVIEDDIRHLELVINQMPSGEQKDSVGRKALRKELSKLIGEKKGRLEEYEDILARWDEYRKTLDNAFFSKCLVKAETASYETISKCELVKFSFKTQLFRKISGRQKKYGEEEVKDYSYSDNGVKTRLVFFRMSYRQSVDASQVSSRDNQGNPVSETANRIFAIRRGSESNYYTQISFKAATENKWVFSFEPVYDINAERELRPFEKYAFLEESSDQIQQYTENGHVISWTGREVDPNTNASFYPNEPERGPHGTNEWDMFSVNSDNNIQFSFESGPEIALTAVTEQQLDGSIEDKYADLTMMSLGLYANRGLQDLRSISALVEQGKNCQIIDITGGSPVLETSDNSTSYAPDIFVDTLLDKENGLGKYIEPANIDVDSLALAKKFCIGNNLPREGGGALINLFMDGIIADVSSWREFWVTTAPFSLLELARKNGKDTLLPALPVNQAGLACDNTGLPVEVEISALFTSGNILQDSYKEEFLNYGTSTEDLVASVVYREINPGEMFSKKRSVTVQRKNVSENFNRETFDLSQFVTQREQAIMFGKLLCNQRRHIKKGIEFKTLPMQASLEPGAFIYVDIGLKNWDKYSSGMIMENGLLNTPLLDNVQDNGTKNFNFLLYRPDTGEIESASSVSVATNAGVSVASSLASKKGYMFVMGENKVSKRVYRVVEVSLEEEGELSVKAIEFPCFEEAAGTRAHIADFRSSNFVVS